MKRKVGEYKGKIIVEGGENPENELQPHEILITNPDVFNTEKKTFSLKGKLIGMSKAHSDKFGLDLKVAETSKIRYLISPKFPNTGAYLTDGSHHYESVDEATQSLVFQSAVMIDEWLYMHKPVAQGKPWILARDLNEAKAFISDLSKRYSSVIPDIESEFLMLKQGLVPVNVSMSIPICWIAP